MRSPLLALVLTAALLSGCLVEEADPDAASTQSNEASNADPAASDPTPADPEPVSEPAEPTPSAPHGTPQRTDSAITTGTDPPSVPGSWARQTITITNGFGEATLGDLAAAISAGSITVLAADRADYLVEAALETRASTEAEARDLLERTHFEHSDVLDGNTLFLDDHIRTDPPVVPNPTPIDLPDINIMGTWLRVDLVITVPLAPAIDLAAGASSGDVSVSDLHGPALDLSTSSGSIAADLCTMGDVKASASSGDIWFDTLVADAVSASTSSGDILGQDLSVGRLEVSTSSGSAVVDGIVDDLSASSSSGDLTFDVAAVNSGEYELGSSSGEVVLSLPADGVYAVKAGTSSGEIVIDLPDAEVIEDEEDHVEVASPGYDDADLRTAIATSTSSGDIVVTAE